MTWGPRKERKKGSMCEGEWSQQPSVSNPSVARSGRSSPSPEALHGALLNTRTVEPGHQLLSPKCLLGVRLAYSVVMENLQTKNTKAGRERGSCGRTC